MSFRTGSSLPYKPFSVWHVRLQYFFVAFVHAACDDVFTEETGVITSPNYPTSYPANSDCTFYVSVPAASRIRVEFNVFALENNHDNLYYGVGRNNAVASALGTLSGTFIPDPIEFEDGVVWFRFISDQSVEYNGFSFTFSATVRKFTEAKFS